MAKKVDGVIEAVHYKNGQIVTVRAYERRGAAFSDRLLLERKELLERLKSKKMFVTGARKEFMAGTFEEGKLLQVVSRDGKDYIATRADADRDDLSPAPVF
jgi:uncharacterized protein YjhX (UPF0386 family)